MSGAASADSVWTREELPWQRIRVLYNRSRLEEKGGQPFKLSSQFMLLIAVLE